MSVRTYDPKEPEFFGPGRCSAPGCGSVYHTICRLCNLAYCRGHLLARPHSCDTHVEFIVLTEEEVRELLG